MTAVPDELQAYTESHTTPTAPHLQRLAEETRATQEQAVMLTGVVEGRFLEMLVFATGARRVLEIGTFTGYSALAMAAALPDDGRIVTLELDPERASIAQRHFDAGPNGDRISVRVGPALESLRSLDGPFDLVFIDADKTGYRDYYEAVLPKLSERGVIAIDNTLWGGKVLPGQDDGGEATAALRELNDFIASDERVVAVQLSIRDGITLIRRA